MEANRRDTYGAGRKRFSFGNIAGDPFALATISIAVVRINIAMDSYYPN